MVMGACGLMVFVIRGMGSFYLIKYDYEDRPQSSELGFSLLGSLVFIKSRPESHLFADDSQALVNFVMHFMFLINPVTR